MTIGAADAAAYADYTQARVPFETALDSVAAAADAGLRVRVDVPLSTRGLASYQDLIQLVAQVKARGAAQMAYFRLHETAENDPHYRGLYVDADAITQEVLGDPCWTLVTLPTRQRAVVDRDGFRIILPARPDPSSSAAWRPTAVTSARAPTPRIFSGKRVNCVCASAIGASTTAATRGSSRRWSILLSISWKFSTGSGDTPTSRPQPCCTSSARSPPMTNTAPLPPPHIAGTLIREILAELRLLELALRHEHAVHTRSLPKYLLSLRQAGNRKRIGRMLENLAELMADKSSIEAYRLNNEEWLNVIVSILYAAVLRRAPLRSAGRVHGERAPERQCRSRVPRQSSSSRTTCGVHSYSS